MGARLATRRHAEARPWRGNPADMKSMKRLRLHLSKVTTMARGPGLATAALLALVCAGCSGATAGAGALDEGPMPEMPGSPPVPRGPLPAGVQAISFLGDTLREFPLAPSVRARYEQQLAEAHAAYVRTPTNVDSIIWLGRRLGYLGRIREAIDIYSKGIALYPDNPWLYRHRGHRYITVRELDNAIADLVRAREIVIPTVDEVEPDGQPNALNQPIGTLKSNIEYHLGLAYYLQHDFVSSLLVYRQEYENATNDDRRVSAGHWLYMCLRRIGHDAEAAAMLRPITRDMRVIENQVYHRLLLMYKGELPVDSVLAPGPSGEMSVTDATAAYGVANWHLYNGRPAEADRIFRRILAGGQWGAFGYIAAERDLFRR